MTSPFHIIVPSAARPSRPPEPARLEIEVAGAEVGTPAPYVLSEALATAINVALALDQPLLVTGEPGGGKTRLAWAIAEQLGTRVLEFHTKSTSVARDLFYTVDTLRRFHDASAGIPDARDALRYLSFQALGEAIRSDLTQVVLIDEIDKAPRDFPNDLLNELDRKEFSIPEVAPVLRFQQKVRHFLLITSNSERRLPAPFLRRCVYAHLAFPDREMLERILSAHVAKFSPARSFVRLAVDRFLELRAVTDLNKPPATAELVGWARVLLQMGIRDEDLVRAPLDRLPAIEALIKTFDDLTLLRRRGE